MKIRLIVILFVLFAVDANGANQWYWGAVSKIQSIGSDGSFQVYLENNDVKNTCSYGRVDFRVQDMGPERTKIAFSMALSAFASGKQWGVVIDLPLTVQVCAASPTASQGAGIQ